MSGPPKDIPASHLWLALMEMPRPSKVVDFPRVGPDGQPVGQLRIWVLTQEEQMICAVAAERFAREHLKDAKKDDLGYESIYSNEVCVQVLFRACRDTDDVTRSAFPTSKSMREKLTTEECGRLFEHYLTIQLELGPIVATMTDAEVDGWITRLVEGGSAFPFDLLSSDIQKVLILALANRLSNSRTATSSAGSPPDDTSTTPPSEPEQAVGSDADEESGDEASTSDL